MNTPHNQRFPGNGFLDRYGYGVFINPYFNHGHEMLTHSGGYFGAMTTLDRYPKDEILVTVLSNNEAESHWISYGLAGILFGKAVEQPYVHQATPVAPAGLPRFAGSYGQLRVGYANGGLYLDSTATPLVAESARKFFRADNPDRTFEFLSNRKGAVYAVVVTKGGVRETVFEKQAQPLAPPERRAALTFAPLCKNRVFPKAPAILAPRRWRAASTFSTSSAARSSRLALPRSKRRRWKTSPCSPASTATRATSCCLKS